MKNIIFFLNRTALLSVVTALISLLMWNILQKTVIVETTCNIPIYFYNTNNIAINYKPENVQITLKGSQRALREALKEQLVLHFDARLFSKKHQYISASEGSLFLTNNAISITNYNPKNISIECNISNHEALALGDNFPIS